MAGLVTDFWKTVHSPLFFRKIVEIERYVHGLPTCMRSKLLGGRVRFGRNSPPPPTTAIIPDARPLGTFENQDTVTVRLSISKRSHEKIADCEQSRFLVSEVGLLFNGLRKRLTRRHAYNYRI